MKLFRRKIDIYLFDCIASKGAMVLTSHIGCKTGSRVFPLFAEYHDILSSYVIKCPTIIYFDASFFMYCMWLYAKDINNI
jgi:hypothetical protein